MTCVPGPLTSVQVHEQNLLRDDCFITDSNLFIRKELLVRFQWTINVQLFCNLSQHFKMNFFSVLNSGGAKSFCASFIEGVTGIIGVELF